MPAQNDGLYTWSRQPVNNFKKGLHRYSKYNDPTYLGFTFLFDWYTPDQNNSYGGSPLFAGYVNEENSNSDPRSWNTKPGTAMDYLKRCGEYQRMIYLNVFIKTLKDINYKMPWYWQQIAGLQEALSYSDFENPYFGGDDAKIDITCLESIDLKLTSLMDLYKKVIYDVEYRRIIIPENLRKFSVYIYVQEIRKFQINSFGPGGLRGNVQNGEPGDKVKERLRLINESSARVAINLTQCEFIPDESNEMFSELFMNSSEVSGQKLSFSYENVRQSSSYPNISSFLENQTANIGSNSFNGADEERNRNINSKIASTDIASEDEPTLEPEINTLRDEIRDRIEDVSQNIRNQANEIINNTLEEPGEQTDLGNVYESNDTEDTTENQLISENIFGASVNLSVDESLTQGVLLGLNI